VDNFCPRRSITWHALLRRLYLFLLFGYLQTIRRHEMTILFCLFPRGKRNTQIDMWLSPMRRHSMMTVHASKGYQQPRSTLRAVEHYDAMSNPHPTVCLLLASVLLIICKHIQFPFILFTCVSRAIICTLLSPSVLVKVPSNWSIIFIVTESSRPQLKSSSIEQYSNIMEAVAAASPSLGASFLPTSSSTILQLLLLMVMLVYLVVQTLVPRRRSTSTAPLPPGAIPWPVVGNLPEMLLSGKPAFRWIHHVMERTGTGITCVKLGGVHVIAINCPSIAREVLKRQDTNFASRSLTLAFETFSGGYMDAIMSGPVLSCYWLGAELKRWAHNNTIN
jgi:hypothetical protein